jgi:hypothetical protein
MRFKIQMEGPRFRILALELNDGSCPAEDYLIGLETRSPASHKRMLSVLKHHADSGPIKNKKISRALEGERYQGLLEFKTPQGARLFYAYAPGGITVLLNGCDKASNMEPCYERARGYKELAGNT